MSWWQWALLGVGAWTVVSVFAAPTLGRRLARRGEEQTYQPTATQLRWWAIWRREGKRLGPYRDAT
jgi:hypothetical protein